MRIDAHEITPGTTLEADVCIAGAGAAGITLARELCRQRRSVCLLEGGGTKRDPASQDLYRGTCELPLSEDYLHDSRLRFLGGTTNHWLGFCRPLDPIDFEERPWVEHSGWPFDFETLAPFYRRAATVCQVDSRFAPPQPLTEDSTGPVRMVYFQTHPLRFGEEYRRELRRTPNLQLLLGANLLHLRLDETGSRLESVEVASAPDRRFQVQAKAYVLALGGLENPRQLLLSNDRQPSGIGNDHYLVGRFFMDHPVYPLGKVCALGDGPFTRMPSDASSPHRVFRLSDEEQATRRLLNASLSFSLVPEVEDTRHQLLAEGAWQALEAHLDERGGPPAAGEDRLSPLHYQRFDIRPEPQPDPQSRVTLGEGRDLFGRPKPHLDWRIGELEVATVRQSFEALAREAGAAGFGRFRLDPDVFLDAAHSPGFHHMGTTRMHADPRRGVVDPNARVHGVSNLYIAGSSVFPTAGYANPTFTLVALALRLADHLAALQR